MGKTAPTPKKKTNAKQSSRGGTATAVAVATREVSDDQVRLRAYELFLATGARPGDDLQHWLQAERELRGSRGQ